MKDTIRKKIAPPALLITLNLAVFWMKFRGEFLTDDFYFNIKANSFAFRIEDLIRLGTFVRSTFFYRPVPLMMWVLLYKTFGSNPFSFHTATLALHILNAVLVYLLFRKLFQQKVALIAACIFSVFTAHLQTVLWLSGIFDMTCTFFVLLAMWASLVFLETRRFAYLIASWFFAVLSLFSKEMAATLPFLILALFMVRLWKEEFNFREARRLLLASLPFFALYFFYALLRVGILYRFRVETPSVLPFVNLTVLSHYLLIISDMLLPNRAVLFSGFAPYLLGIFALILILSFYFRKETRSALAFGLVWMLGTSVPALIMIETYHYGHVLFNRFNYLPSIGFCLIIATLLVFAADNATKRRMSALLACAVIFSYSLNTIFYSQDWISAWRAKRSFEERFQTNLLPAFEQPAKVYFFQVPEKVFFTGLTECFSFLTKNEKVDCYSALEWTSAYVNSPENTSVEPHSRHCYFFQWDPAATNFKKIGDFSSGPVDTGGGIFHGAFVWDFSRYGDSAQWEPVHELARVPDRSAQFGRFLTTGKFSFLKSPLLNDKNLACVQLAYRATCPKNDPITGQLFWVTGNDQKYDEKKSIRFPVANDQSIHTYTIPLDVNAWFMRDADVGRIAVRLSNRAGTMIDLKSIAVYRFQPPQ